MIRYLKVQLWTASVGAIWPQNLKNVRTHLSRRLVSRRLVRWAWSHGRGQGYEGYDQKARLRQRQSLGHGQVAWPRVTWSMVLHGSSWVERLLGTAQVPCRSTTANMIRGEQTHG